MRETWPSALRGYLVAVAATAAAVAVRWLVDPWVGDQLALVTLPAAVAATVWVGGYRPALAAAAAGYVACAYLFGRPSAASGSEVSELFVLLIYLSSCSIIVAIGEAMRRAQARAAQRQAFLWVTLGSIGDAVITTDTEGRITFMNAVAESMTGWSQREAAGRSLEAVVHIVDERTRETVENPAKRALREGAIVGLASHSVLAARDGTERPIDDSTAPIRDEGGHVVGCVLIFRDITDRRRAERALRRSEAKLRESEQRLRLALEAGRMGAWEWSAATNSVVWSPTLEAIHGLEPGTFGGTFEAYQQAVHPDDVKSVRASIERAMEGGDEHQVEYRIVWPDGSVHWVEDRGRVVAGQDGAPGGIVGVCVDITERKRAEQARKESEERFVRFMRYLPGLAWIKDLQGRYVFANDAALKAFRTSREGLYRRTDEEVFPPETATRLVENDRRAVATGTAVQAVELLDHEDGTFHQSIVSKFPIPGPDGEAAWVGGIAIDVTEQRRVEGALRDSEARLRAVFDTVVDGIITINESGIIESVNPAVERLFGYSLAELAGRNVSMLMPDPYHREHESYLESCGRAGERKIIGIGREVVGLRKDGTQFPMDLAVSELSLGGRRMFTGLVRDITERKRAEEGLREADRRKTEFLATLAHELRNPLAPIRNSLEILKRAERDPRARRQGRETIERQLGHLVRLVDDLVDVSRITRDRLELRRTRVELASVVHDAVETCRPLAEREQQAIELALPEPAVCLEADPVRLVQVFGNLLNNACKYTPRGGTIRLAATRRGGDVLVSVKDSGIGIPPDKLESVFAMFAQIEAPAGGSRVGLGIGLALAKRLVELHGGTIEARSEGLGRGSEFVVRLPVAAERPKGRESAATVAPRHMVAPLRVLVVDDNEDSAVSLSKLLSLGGHETRTANDGLATVEAAERFRPDVVLLDIGLPKLSGLDACRRIREQPWGRSMVMIALTGWGQPDDRDRSRHAGFDGHLVKPVAHEDLMRVLDSLTSGPRGPQPEA